MTTFNHHHLEHSATHPTVRSSRAGAYGPRTHRTAFRRAVVALTGVALALFVVPLFAAKIALTGVVGFPNGRTVNDVTSNAIDGDITTFTWTTNPNNVSTPSYLAISFDATVVNRLRLWKQSQGGGGNNSKNLVILYTTDSGPLGSRKWTPVSHLANGFLGYELMHATAVNADGTVTEDVHDSTSGDGWASLTFDKVMATGLAIAFSNPHPLYDVCNGLTIDQPCNHYRVGEFEAYFEVSIVAVFEFYNTTLDTYFITANAQEAAGIDNGAAGPGWVRTGAAFNFKAGGLTPVCRFYGSLSPGPNSHFYTAYSAECDMLRALQASTPATQPRWNFESLDFMTSLPTTAGCPAGTIPVFRAYNNGSNRHIDSNHRITANQAGIDAVVAKGWISEGVVMCAPM